MRLYRSKIKPNVMLNCFLTPMLVPNLKTKNFFFEKNNLDIAGIIISGGNDINKKSIRF